MRLLIQWCQIVGPCNIDACTAVVIQFNIQCSGKACDRSAYNRDRGCGIGTGLKGSCSVGHDQVRAVVDKLVGDSGTCLGVTLCILKVELYVILA